jgi:cephalosporin hydroxylase
MDNKTFFKENQKMVKSMGENSSLKELTQEWFNKASEFEYSYHFTWMGVPIIQFPQDIVATQEIVWNIKPDLIIETGVARGGSVLFYASLLELIGNGEVLGIDIDIREHNYNVIRNHPMFSRVSLLQGSSISGEIFEKVREKAINAKTIMVILDSNHTHEHVIEELKLYSPLVTKGSYLIVFDTVVEDMPSDYNWNGRPWGKGNNPKTAVHEFLKEHPEFEIDMDIQHKLLITVAPDGYLKRVK